MQAGISKVFLARLHCGVAVMCADVRCLDLQTIPSYARGLFLFGAVRHCVWRVLCMSAEAF